MDFQPGTGEQVVRWQESGMSLRDWFAGQALAGLLASGVMRDLGDVQPGDGLFGHHRAAKLAMLAADAMLAQREKGGEE
jgi:hypothetical protein